MTRVQATLKRNGLVCSLIQRHDLSCIGCIIHVAASSPGLEKDQKLKMHNNQAMYPSIVIITSWLCKILDSTFLNFWLTTICGLRNAMCCCRKPIFVMNNSHNDDDDYTCSMPSSSSPTFPGISHRGIKYLLSHQRYTERPTSWVNIVALLAVTAVRLVHVNFT